jgi:hypothetical protein
MCKTFNAQASRLRNQVAAATAKKRDVAGSKLNCQDTLPIVLSTSKRNGRGDPAENYGDARDV